MGMFDTVYFKCPHCDAYFDVQSKRGPRILNNYSNEEVPADIAFDLIDTKHVCDNCKKSVKIVEKVPVPKVVHLIAIKQEE